MLYSSACEVLKNKENWYSRDSCANFRRQSYQQPYTQPCFQLFCHQKYVILFCCHDHKIIDQSLYDKLFTSRLFIGGLVKKKYVRNVVEQSF